MLPGFGLTRRLMTPALIAFAFWSGLHVARLAGDRACEDAGGMVDRQGLCRGLP